MVTLESKTVYTCPAHAPSIQSCGVCCFLQVAWTAAQHNSMEGPGGGGGTPGNSWWGCAAQFSKSWPYFRPKDVISHTCFQTRPLKSMPVFRTGLYAEIMLLLFLSYSFGIETMNTFIHSRSSFKNHTWFQTGKVFTCFQTEMAQKPTPMVRHILT